MFQLNSAKQPASAWQKRYLTASRFTLLEQTHNRLAIILLVVFVPIWYFFTGDITPPDALAFKLSATGELLNVNGHNLILITGGLTAITMIIGFMLFTSTRQDTPFDRRLILSGYPQPILILAKITNLGLVTGLISLYATGVLYLFWQPDHPFIIWLGFFSTGLIYGGLGLLLGVLLKGELEGFFLIIMTSMMDTFLQNPLGNPVANQDFLKFFPSYGPMQLLVSGEFAGITRLEYFFLSLAWFGGFILLGLVIFLWKTRSAIKTGPVSPPDSAGN